MSERRHQPAEIESRTAAEERNCANSGWPDRIRTAAALAFLLALTAGYYWKLTLSSSYTWLENPDQAYQVRPWLDYEAREFHAGRLPLWDPYHWGGQSLIGQVQPGLTNPVNWILFAMPLRDGHIPLGILHWYWVLIHWLAAAFCFWLCRDLGAGYLASIVGASVFAFAGFMGKSATPQFLMSAMWAPLVFLFLARVFRGQRPLASAVLCGASLGAALLSGHHNVPIYTAVLLGGLWIWYAATHRDRAWLALVCALACGLVSAVQVLPALEYGRRAVRWSGTPEPQRWKDRIPYSVHAEYSLRASSLPGLAIPNQPAHASPFVGIVALSLALSAIALQWRRPEVRLMTAVAVGGLLLALGSDTPVHGLVYGWIPMVEKARYPAMAVVLCQVGIAALAALGVEAARGWKNCLVPLAFGVTILGVCAALAAVHRLPPGQLSWTMAVWPVLLGGALWFRRAAPAFVLVLFLAEAATSQPPIQRLHQPGSYLDQVTAQADIAQFLKSQPGWFRIEKDEDAVPYNFGDFHGIEEFSGYVASMPDNVLRVVGHAETPRMFGIQFWVARKPGNDRQVEVFESRSGVKVYRNPGIGEPLWSVHDAPCGGADSLRVVSRQPEAFTVDADFACPGLAVAGDPWYKGWRAWVDGSPVRIQEFEGVVRAVATPAGRHRIEFRYRPVLVYWGAVLTAVGCLAALLCCVTGRKQGTPCDAR